MYEKIKEIIAEVAQMLSEQMGEEDVAAVITMRMIESHCQYEVDLVDSQGEFKSVKPEHPYHEWFKKLRRAMYETAPGKGAWYTAIVEVKENGEVTTRFDYDDLSQFSITPTAEDIEEDSKAYPRWPEFRRDET